MLRGRLRLKDGDFQIVAGDRVRIREPERAGDAPAIEDVDKRESWLSRYVERDGSERVIVANMRALYVVATLRSPPVHFEFIDRVLVSGERGGVPGGVVLNKIDLVDDEGEIDRIARVYTSCGYRFFRTNALTGQGVGDLAAEIKGGVCAFVGESGVGKSSLLMSIDPGLNLKVRSLGERTGRGRHTTTFSQLYEFGAGYLADTPGMQTFGYPGTDSAGLSSCFPEFREYEDACRFSPCTHSHEPGCAVKAALTAGRIAGTRYQSYLNILSEMEARGKRPPGK
jgi:ribosome biogenesis GTPase